MIIENKQQNGQPKSYLIISYIKHKWAKHSNKKASTKNTHTQKAQTTSQTKPKTQTICYLKHFEIQRHNMFKVKEGRKIYHEKSNHKRGGVAMLVSGKETQMSNILDTKINIIC